MHCNLDEKRLVAIALELLLHAAVVGERVQPLAHDFGRYLVSVQNVLDLGLLAPDADGFALGPEPRAVVVVRQRRVSRPGSAC